jgi:hypothetical protein
MKSIVFIAIFTLILFITSCIPDETPVTPHQKGDVKIGYVQMGNTYANQIYFNLEQDTVVASNLITDWDLAFASNPDSIVAFITNGGCFMSVYNTGKTKFEDVTSADTAGLDVNLWNYDNPKGDLDSTAFGVWWESKSPSQIISKSEVYIINRGVTDRGKPRDFKKFQILGYENNTYYIKFSDLNANQAAELEIPRNPLYNFIHISLNNNGTIVPIEPTTDKWDFCFTKYTELLYTNDGQAMWYSVTGPLINPNRVSVAIADTSMTFENITYDYAKNLKYSNYINAIGHDWKTFDLGQGFYIINIKKVYIIQTPVAYYKLHFTDFYNTSGEKGYPKFEYQKL